MAKGKKNQVQENCLVRVSNAIVTTLEDLFYRHGKRVASKPVLYIIFCLIIAGLCSLGFLNFYIETRPEKLWIPQDSDYVKAMNWRDENFPNYERREMALYEAENVLTPTVIQEMYRIFKKVGQITVTDEYGRKLNQTNLCYKVPALSLSTMDSQQPFLLRKYSQSGDFMKTDWSTILEESMYCKIRKMIPRACLELSILDLWGDDSKKLYSLTQQDIINSINTVELSATYGFPFQFTDFLGGVTLNSTGHVVGAKATIHTWMMLANVSAVSEQGTTSGTDSALVDAPLYDWEAKFLDTVLNTSDRPEEVTVYVSSERSFGEISSNTIMGDVFYLVVGMSMLYTYVTLVLGKFDYVQQRPFLSLLGITSILLAVVIAFGLCSAIGLPYGPVHSILPMLLFGLGVDDMFVLVQCYNNLPLEERQTAVLKEQIGRTVQHAGVAITVTSLTDMLAFAIGSTTVLPALQSFCVYSAVGIAALYFLQATLFVALFYFDQKRMFDNRNGLFWCYKHEDHQPSKCSQFNFCQMFFKKIFSKLLLSKVGKTLTLLVTAAMVAVSIWGVTNLRQEFNPVWFIPQSSYLFGFLSNIQIYFPDAGTRGTVYMGALDYPSELPQIDAMTSKLLADPDVSNVESWYFDLVEYVAKDAAAVDIKGKQLNSTYFSSILGKFLFSPMGSRYLDNFNFKEKPICGSPAPLILASKFDYQHSQMEGRDEQIDAMDRVKAIIYDEEFSDLVAPVALMYSSWETDKIIAHELVRNVTLALVAVIVMSLLLIANVITASFVFLCVAITLIEVMALMTWWGLTIDTVSCINLVLCIGLCVDYSAHIGLHFMQVCGTRDERVHKSLVEIGPAVWHGAFSTLLSFVFLALSDSHVFISFFKIFFGVFVFGVYQGLVFLPVVLSLFGPPPYSSADKIPVKKNDDAEASQAEREDVELSDEEWKQHERKS